MNEATPISASFLMYKDGTVVLEDDNNQRIQYPITSFSKEDQTFIFDKHILIKRINEQAVKNESSANYAYSRMSVRIFLGFGWLCLFIFIYRLAAKKSHVMGTISGATLSCLFLSLASCNGDLAPTANNQDVIDVDVPANNVSTMQGLFGHFSDVSTTSDDTYFYVSSTGIPDHNMMVGITSWQQQVPVPQSYTGSNSWSIPLQPELSASPLSTSSHLLKGAIAIGVNGIPIFNPLNNRGEDAKAFGELDDWGGHCGKADDYHYHIPPTHLQSVVGTGNPIAYALDGFPIYGSTTETLDVYLGKLNEDGSYQYHTIDAFPYFMAGMRGNVSLDPNTTAPEDQIIPQALSTPLRGGDYGPLNGAVITSFTSIGTNAYSLQYTQNSGTYTVEYNGDTNGLYTFKYINPGGTFTTETYGPGTTTSDFTLTSIAISNGELLDAYKCEAKVNNIENSIPLAWSNVPTGTNALAITMHHFPNSADTTIVNSYLSLWGIDPSVSEIPYGKADDGSWFMGANKDGNTISYTSPCSPSAGVHAYTITLYALSGTPAGLPDTSSLNVTYSVLKNEMTTVTTIGTATLTFNDVN